MKERIFELLKPEDIEVRVGYRKDGKTSLLLYQETRRVMDALDEAFGVMGWQVTHHCCGEQIYGALEVWDGDKEQWIVKEDTGEESNISAEKGMSSDILKRCAVRFGRGRELYSAPKIVLNRETAAWEKFYVRRIGYDDSNRINDLVIVNAKGEVEFEMGKKPKPAQQAQQKPEKKERNSKIMRDYCIVLNENGEDTEEIKKFYAFYTDGKKVNVNEWENRVNPEKLWKQWNEKKITE